MRYNDEEKLRNLEEKVIPYVTKTDFYVDMVKLDGHRSFWKSQPPKIEARRRGRKRSKTGVALPLVKAKPVADFEECQQRFSNSAGEGSGSPRMGVAIEEQGIGAVARSIGAVMDSGDIQWHNPVA